MSKKLVIRFTSALIISGSVGTVAYAGTTDKIIIEVDGKKQEIYTHANTIDELLQDEKIQVTEKVIQEGIEGKKKKVFAVIKEDGNEVLRNLQKEEIVQEEKSRIVAVGTKEEEHILSDAEGVVANEFYVQATAYSPYCGGCQGVSAGGYNYKANPNMKLIAVDPRIIPLGTKVWVEGYGYAVAGDTGGAIKGNRIDVLMPTESQAEAWGRKQVKIKVLQ
ncbi:3D domain-containing protein [Bacillus sp. JJ864]|uniref:3D domain-containing protein n=1 Tax=Bacillus sp. JJ864 TaxID=3122975 RepID=UPI003000722D